MEQQEGAPRAKIRFVPNCGKPEYFRTRNTNFDAPDRPFKVCVVGRLVEVKNHKVSIDALAHLPPDTRPQLHLFGDGRLQDTIIARAQAAVVADDVIVHGFVSASIADQLRHMDA